VSLFSFILDSNLGLKNPRGRKWQRTRQLKGKRAY
jgi:hypothetical protein